VGSLVGSPLASSVSSEDILAQRGGKDAGWDEDTLPEFIDIIIRGWAEVDETLGAKLQKCGGLRFERMFVNNRKRSAQTVVAHLPGDIGRLRARPWDDGYLYMT
jgi:hypothetical protein